MARTCQPQNSSLAAISCCVMLATTVGARLCGASEFPMTGSRALAQAVPGDCEVHDGVDFPAAAKLNDGNEDTVENVEECCALCKSTEDCAVWTFMKTGSGGKSAGSCWLKLPDSTTADCEKCTSGFAPESARRMRMRMRSAKYCVSMENLNFNSADLGTLSAPRTANLRQCCDLCQMRPGCKAWTQLYDGRCLLRSSVKTPSICEHCEASGLVDGRLKVEEIRAVKDLLDLVAQKDGYQEAAAGFLVQLENLTVGK